MAEFCLKHYNEMFDENLTEEDVVLEMDFCEECGDIKPCVICLKRKTFVSKQLDKIFHRN